LAPKPLGLATALIKSRISDHGHFVNHSGFQKIT
jgi:hypothetical protein